MGGGGGYLVKACAILFFSMYDATQRIAVNVFLPPPPIFT